MITGPILAQAPRVDVLEVRTDRPTDASPPWSIDTPRAQTSVDGPCVEIAGRIPAGGSVVAAVEIVVDGEVVARERVVPDTHGGTAFSARVPVVGTDRVDAQVHAVGADRSRRSLGSVALQRSPASPRGLVSVVIPCYDQAHFLPEAIGSVLAQTYPDVELIVVDDGSRDNTSAVVGRYPGVRGIRQPNRGLAAARNTGLAAATGRYVVFLDADDLLLPEALEAGVTALEAHPDAAFVFGQTMFLMDDGSEPPAPHRARITGHPYAALLAGCPIMSIESVVFRRAVFDELEAFDPVLRAAEDYDLYYRIARRRPIASHGAVVAVYRRHRASMTSGSVRGLLRANLTALHRQRRYVSWHPPYWRAYRAGARYWRLHYGTRLVAEVQRLVAEHHWAGAAKAVATLIRWWPRGVGVLVSSRRRFLALPEWSPTS